MAEGGGKAPEGPAEGAKAFVSSLVAAAEQPGPKPDPNVSVALALGWQMAEIYQPAAWPIQPPRRGDDLPGLSELSGVERALVGLAQVDVALSRLKDAITEHGPGAPTTAKAREALHASRPTDDAFRDTIFDLHVELLATFTAASFKLGKAYGLGRALADTTRQPQDIPSVKAQLERHRVANLQAWLADLSSVLPAHAGHAVYESLGLWRDWAAEDTPKLNPGEDLRRVIRLLRRQGERWRALLSGEKASADTLELQEYVAAGSDALMRLGGLTWRFVRRFFVLLIVAAALFGFGIWVILSDSNSGHIAAGLSGVLAALGLTWKGVGGSLGQTAGKLERPVWEATLDRQIAQAVTRLPGTKKVKGYTAPASGYRAAASTAPVPPTEPRQ
jgi:hypothetical protein